MVLFHINENIFTSNCDYLVNPVNCVGVMGKGLALQFKEKFPYMFIDYKDKCIRKEVKPGVPYIYKNIINFPTKDDWRNLSQMSWIIKGLNWIKDNLHNVSIAIPPVGCGLGGLNQDEVFKYMYDIFNESDIQLNIYVK